MVKTWGYLMSTSDQPWAAEWCTASTLSRWSFTFTFAFFLLSFNWNLRSSFTLISGIFLSTPDTPSCSHPTSLPLLLPKLPLFAFDSTTLHSGFVFFVNSPYSSPPSTLLFFSVYLSCIFNAFETFKSLLVQLDFKIKQLSSVCVGWEGMRRWRNAEKGWSAMHEVTGTGPGLYFRRVGCFWESEGEKRHGADDSYEHSADHQVHEPVNDTDISLYTNLQFSGKRRPVYNTVDHIGSISGNKRDG